MVIFACETLDSQILQNQYHLYMDSIDYLSEICQFFRFKFLNIIIIFSKITILHFVQKSFTIICLQTIINIISHIFTNCLINYMVLKNIIKIIKLIKMRYEFLRI
ncbi:hypothetical protein H312_03356 [Anncaliia algerae PRA339]|uniref:Transmembrane protein n=1 Tax=Anncaliia algerae PRA339 TaxID=1288291 RepID=A0A059EX01_9MICR|nr:hypothetical protein H312_03356 [Anncaliia algerae PRA339]